MDARAEWSEEYVDCRRVARVIAFTVFGEPRTAGSKRAFALKRRDGSLVTRPNGSPIINVTDDNVKSKSWRHDVAWMARKIVGSMRELLGGPIRVSFTFYRPRPKGHFGKSGLNGAGRASFYPTTKPDVLKLARAVEDALTGVIWRDDALIVDEHLRKLWGEPARVEIEIEPLAPQQVEFGLFREQQPREVAANPF